MKTFDPTPWLVVYHPSFQSYLVLFYDRIKTRLKIMNFNPPGWSLI